jgi:protein-disulfide isomerase
MNIDDINNAANTAANTTTPTTTTPATPTNVPKSDKPVVELFVMSHCPYGTQIEKGILPVMSTLANKADIQIKFVNYAMHGQAEVEDNIRQYCISKEQPAKYNAYLTCFLKAGDAKGCITSTGVDSAKLDKCFSATDTKYSLLKDFNDKTTWNGSSYPPFSIDEALNKKYNIQGSPTLVINGTTVESNRDSASLLATVCAAFKTKPSECNTKLSSASPSAGFGEGTDASGAAANCAPAPTN